MYDELVKRLREPCQYENCVLCQQAADAIEELSKPKWIPVEERLPQETQRCIVVSKCGEMAFAIYKGNGFQYPHYMGKATHWMPLPQPPKEE